jgi:elongator complex protein 3
LLKEAERIAGDEFKAGSISILAGVGAREYFRQFGYRLEGAYMVKALRTPSL